MLQEFPLVEKSILQGDHSSQLVANLIQNLDHNLMKRKKSKVTMMKKNCKVLVTGGRGLIGHAIQSITKNDDSNEWIFVGSSDADLRMLDQTDALFQKHRPQYVIHLAAKVGGLFKNMAEKLEFFRDNMAINDNVLQCCHIYGVKKCICCLSTCIFPDQTTYPIDETMIHNGPPHPSNEGYAYAKRMLDVLVRLYNERYQDGCKFVSIVPTNIFGPHDNFNLDSGHVIPNLIKKTYDAKDLSVPLVVYGSGKPKRQFIYSLDLARLILMVLDRYETTEPMILSVGENDEISITDAAQTIASVAQFDQPIIYDTSKADGQYKKTANNSKLMNWIKEQNIDFIFTPFEQAIRETCQWYILNQITQKLKQ